MRRIIEEASLVVFFSLIMGVLGGDAVNNESMSEVKEVKTLYTVDSYMKSVEENLEVKSETFINNIKELHKYTIYSDVELLDFVAFIDDFGVSITMFSMDRHANEVFNEGKDVTILAGSLGMIENAKYVHLFGNQTADFWNFYKKMMKNLVLQKNKRLLLG